MKLYTEEQVKGILIRHLNYSTLISLDEKDLEGAMENSVIEILKEVIPIELPSDEELEEWIINRNYEFSRVDIQTTKWVIEQIKQQENGKS